MDDASSCPQASDSRHLDRDCKRSGTLDEDENDVVVPYPLVTVSIDLVDGAALKSGKKKELLLESKDVYDFRAFSEIDRYLVKAPLQDHDDDGKGKKWTYDHDKSSFCVSVSIFPREYQRTLRMHRMVCENDAKSLKKLLEEQKYDVNSQDSYGNTALVLAAMLGRTECIIILIKHGAKIKQRNKEGWSALNEAISYGNFDNIRILWSEAKKQVGDDIRVRATQIRESVERLKDLYIRLDWRFRSWIPFLSSFCPSDTIQIWKRGNSVRVQATLIGLKSFRWQRGNIAFLFNFRRGKQFSGLLMNNEAKTYAVIQGGGGGGQQNDRLKKEKMGKHWEKIIDKEVSAFMSNPNQRTFIPGHLQFQRATSGMIFTSEKTGKVGNYDTRVFNVLKLQILHTLRMEHMSSEEIKAFKENSNGPTSATELTQHLREAKAKAEEEEEEEENEKLLERDEEERTGKRGVNSKQYIGNNPNNEEEEEEEGSDEEDNDDSDFEPHDSLTPPHPPSKRQMDTYLKYASSDVGLVEGRMMGATDVGVNGESSSSSSSSPSTTVSTRNDKQKQKQLKKAREQAIEALSRRRIVESNTREVKPEIHMCDDFPITKNMVVTLLDLVAPHHPNISKLRNFLTVKMPEGFPIKLTLPVFPTISADVTFAECDIGTEMVPQSMFELPDEYRRVELPQILEVNPTNTS